MTFRRILRRLLSAGYFPREVPPVITTRAFGLLLARNWKSRPPAFQNNPRSTIPARHSLVRSGPLRRSLLIPNPVSYAALADELASNWVEIERSILLSPFSKSRPVFHHRGGRAFLPLFSRNRLVELRARSRAGRRVLVSTDIARFYASIYTHSIPWALHGKDVAKARRNDDKLTGNRIDRASRNCTGSQTIGIPIGPDSSLVIAELILAAVDRQLQSEFRGCKTFRHMDEYEVAVGSRDQAEEVLASIQRTLGNYELELNPRKTTIDELPTYHEAPWVSVLRTLSIPKHPTAQANSLVRLFDLGFVTAREAPSEPVLRYLTGRAKNTMVDLKNWRLFQHLLLESITAEPGTIPNVMTAILKHKEEHFALDRDAIAETLNGVIGRHAPLGHDNEVAWALWSLMTLKLPVTSDAAEKLSMTNDPVVMLVALHAEASGLTDSNLDKEPWLKAIGDPEAALADEHWLTVYEASNRGWLPIDPNVVLGNESFSFLRRLDVTFYDESAIESPDPTGVPPSTGFAPSFYP